MPLQHQNSVNKSSPELFANGGVHVALMGTRHAGPGKSKSTKADTYIGGRNGIVLKHCCLGARGKEIMQK